MDKTIQEFFIKIREGRELYNEIRTGDLERYLLFQECIQEIFGQTGEKDIIEPIFWDQLPRQ